MWNIKEYMYGDNTFSGIRYLLGYDTILDLSLREGYLMYKTGIILNVFHTFIGDFFCDFGPYGALLLVIVFILPLILRFKYNSNSVSFHSVLYVSIWYSICMYGMLYFPFKVSFLNFSLIIQFSLIAFWWFMGNRIKEPS